MPRIQTNIVAFGDTHCGSATGLWPDSLITDSGNTIVSNEVQIWLKQCWDHMYSEIRRLRPKPIGVFMGDGIQGGNERRQRELVTNKTSTQAYALRRMIEPIRPRLAELFWVRGTVYHVGDGAEDVEMAAEMLDAKPVMQDGQPISYSRWDVNIRLGKGEDAPVANFAHAVGTSRVAAYQASVPLRDSLAFIDEVNRYTVDSPNIKVVVRAHRHRSVVVGVPPGIWGAVTPCWQYQSEYARQKGLTLWPHIGWLLIQYDGKDVVIKPRTYTGPGIRVEVIE